MGKSIENGKEKRAKQSPSRIAGESRLLHTGPRPGTGSEMCGAIERVDVAGLALTLLLLAGEAAGACGLLQLGARGLDEIEDDLKMAGRLPKPMAGHDYARAAMAFAPVVEGELDFRALRKGPLGEEDYTLRRPMDLVVNEVD